MARTQAGIWITDPKAYHRKLQDLLGDRDPIAVLSETPDVIAGIVKEHSTTKMRARPFEGKWTPNEIIGHLTDAEWIFGFRVRHILCENQPPIVGMDQDLWVEGQKHNDREPTELVDMFRGLRRYNLVLWKSLRSVELTRVGQHSERGPESLGLMLRMNAGHDLSHIDQITRYLAAVKNA